mgnify:CR=1 FL=1
MGQVIERIFISKDWITIIILMIITLLIFNKIRHPLKFNKLQTLLYSSGYIGSYSKSIPLILSVFNIIFIFIFIIVISLLIFIATSLYGFNNNNDVIFFFKIFIFALSYILVRFIIGFLLSILFEKEKEQQYFTFLKLSYLSSFSILILPLLIVNFYINSTIYSHLVIILACLLLIYFFVLQIKNNHNLVFSNIFYFILYLCALEIAPYMIVYKLLIV